MSNTKLKSASRFIAIFDVLGFKDLMESEGTDVLGKWVAFTGYLTYDYWHRGNSSNRKKTGNIWRETAWEVHPITSFRIVPAP